MLEGGQRVLRAQPGAAAVRNDVELAVEERMRRSGLGEQERGAVPRGERCDDAEDEPQDDSSGQPAGLAAVFLAMISAEYFFR